LAYIEENLKVRGKPRDQEEDEEKKPYDPEEELFKAASGRWKTGASNPKEEGNVTSSMSMLTAIPEVDLGMEYVCVSV
jgi:hypothetical protein